MAPEPASRLRPGATRATGWEALPGALRQKLARLGITRNVGLLLHLPLRYEDETRVLPLAAAVPLAALPEAVPCLVEVQVQAVHVDAGGRRQLRAMVADASGGLVLRWLNFHGGQLRQLEGLRDAGGWLRCYGEIRSGYYGAEMVHPRLTPVVADVHGHAPANTPLPTTLTPVYPTVAGLAQSALRKLSLRAQSQLLPPEGAAPGSARTLADPLPPAWRARWRLPGLARSLRFLHAPSPGVDLEALAKREHPAWQRIIFDELLTQQLSLRRAMRARQALQQAPALQTSGALAAALLAQLPFALTGAQRRVVDEISADLAQAYPMRRLLQGDVGSGKTIVAALAALQAIEAGWQVAFMAPTELLAEQHYAKLCQWLTPLGIRTVWLSGSLKGKARQAALAQAADAENGAQLVVGTHALIQDKADFARLGLALVDEQHRFGVAQRLALRNKGSGGVIPHQLMMSATPIPRTLAMSYYADLDVSVIDELPPGRTPIQTQVISTTRRDAVIARLHAAIAEGRQIYWVCPLIEESEKLELQAAIDTHAELAAAFAPQGVGLVHGRLKAEEKAVTMQAFASGALPVLVATTVIEVGVDVPNASVMVIEHAERFGLSQLHQLRGRVGRGAAESSCLLLYAAPLSATARARLKIVAQHTDGFEIARQDLLLRGPGEFIGCRQSGMPMLRYADLERDAKWIEPAQETADALLAEAPQAVAAYLDLWLGGSEALLEA